MTDEANEILSVRDTVTSAYDRIENEETEDTIDIEASTDTDEAGIPVSDENNNLTTDEANALSKADADEAISDTDSIIPADTQLKEDKAPAADAIAYPEHWDKAFKEEFEATPPGVQKFLLERHKSMEADYTKKSMEHSDFLRDYGPVKQILAPFEAAMKQHNMPPSQLIRQWAVAENHLNTNPEKALMQIAQHYGVDLNQLADNNFMQAPNGQGEQPQIDPVVQDLSKQVNSLQEVISGQQVQTFESAINTFADEVDGAGQAAHPYFDEVIPDMMQLLAFERSQGREPAIGDLYVKACRMNTSVFEKSTAAQQNATATTHAATDAANKKQEEARLKAQKAKDAASSVTGDPGANISAHKDAPGTVRNAALDAWDKHTH